MPGSALVSPPFGRGPVWKWSVCGLLLLATMVNYMDRLTLNQMATPIKQHFHLGDREYGQLEAAFGVAFALGAILAGWMVDRWNVRWVYPAAVVVWSMAGFVTGLTQTFASLLACRFLLGLAEAANWPCALRTTQHLLAPDERTMGNSILQSGAALGAVLTPLIVLELWQLTGTWRWSFMAIGTVGLAWTAAWLCTVRQKDLERRPLLRAPAVGGILAWLIGLYCADLVVHVGAREGWLPSWLPLPVKALATVLGIAGVVVWLTRVSRAETRLPRRLFLRRFAALATMVVAINLTWHFFRAWLPLFLREQHHYSFDEFSWFSMAYYTSADLGSLAAGFATLGLARWGLGVHTSRLIVLGCCALLTTSSLVAAVLPAGPLLLGILLLIGFAALGLFPAYYSFSQDLTVEHQGKLTGALGCICWLAMALLHEVVGDVVERSGSYSAGVAAAGLVPLVGLAALLALWGRDPILQPQVREDEFLSSTARQEGIQVKDGRLTNGAPEASGQQSISPSPLDGS
jgi:ACS family hexuronate transporter-like MFS transporter